jgi:dipeptidyl aminopeptidase/acylaminoacyl peptidase
MRRTPFAFLLLSLLEFGWSAAGQSVAAPTKQPFTVETMLKLARISEPALSPDGAWVAYVVQSIDLANNTKPTQIYLVPLLGGPTRPLTRDGSVNDRPKWSPDSKQIYFVSNRSGSSQVWVMNADGTEPRQITKLSTEASGVLIAPDGQHIVFLSNVYPECSADDACNSKHIEDEAKNKSKARLYTSLLYRHWNEYRGARRQHLLIAKTDGTEVIDLTPGQYDVPPFSLGGPDDYAISPDSQEIAFTMNVDVDAAWSTNSDIYVVSGSGGQIRKITSGAGADNAPSYSPDSKMLAFRSQARAGFESDRWRLMVLDRTSGRTSSLTDALDRWVGSYTWSPDSTRLFFTSEDRGRTGVQMIQATGGGMRNIITGPSTLDDVQFTSDGKTMIYTEVSGSHPAEIFRATSGGGSGVPLTHLNDNVLGSAELTPLEELNADSPDRSRIQSFIVKPPAFSETRHYPVLFLIHGGPQGSWGESWTYRWNAQVMAAAGYVVVMPNPRGSTGYGQKFIDDISGDWGGKVYDDLMAVVDKVSALPYVDKERMVAAGGSYGGYMVNWLLGHTRRFKAFVSHAGVFDLRSMAAETEELWFVKAEFQGLPWDNPEVYQRWSPSNFVRDFKTPTLVIHGELDYRVPVSQGLQLFTALQSQKVPSRLLLFPDEGHWVLKPQNTVLWYSQFLGWMDQWTKLN